MVSKYTDKNKFGGFTWKIKIDNLFHIYILGTDNTSYIVEFKEWKWISYKTHFTFVSNKDLKNTIIEIFEKAFVFFQNHNDYKWSESQKNQKLENTIKVFEKLPDISTTNEENKDEKIKLAMEQMYGLGSVPVPIPVASTKNEDIVSSEMSETYSEEIIDKKISELLYSHDLNGAINLLETNVSTNETNLSSLVMLARLKILKKDKNQVHKIILRILNLTQSKIGFLTESEIEDVDLVIAEFEKM